jgi:serine protease Do
MSEPEASLHNAEPQGFENSAGEKQSRIEGAPSPAEGGNPFYADAHYEPAGSTTTPPRYYTPPVRQERVKRSRPARTREKRSVHLGTVFAMCLICAILGGILGAGLNYWMTETRFDAVERALAQNTAENEANAQTIAAISQRQNSPAMPVVSASGELAPAEIYQQACQQVVWITTKITTSSHFGSVKEAKISGSGFILSEDGIILTNYHVVETADVAGLPLTVILYDGTEYEAQILGKEEVNDLAVLKVEATGLKPVTMGDSDEIQVGDEIYVVGNPLGELEFSMCFGHVSALNRIITTDEAEDIPMFQLDAAVNRGNSGGPVYNARGEVIGVVTAKYRGDTVEGLGFAIPSNDALRIAQDLVANGYVTGKAYMGVWLDDGYNSIAAQYYGMPLGAYVQGVEAESAAARAGLRPGDIITAIGEDPVESPSDLGSILRQYSAGDSVKISVYRAGQNLTVTLVFDEKIPASVSESPAGDDQP